MAIYDVESNRIVIRVVYDGPANAGKTTNLRKLEGFFTRQRRSDLYTPAETPDGRTLFFDWLQLEGGIVGGIGLRSQLVTVPGQPALAGRRRRLLSLADAVVLVCESTQSGLDAARATAASMFDTLAAFGMSSTPVIVQANKQDSDDAIEPALVASRIGLPAGTRVIGARASEGHGVRETVVLAIRAAADGAQRCLLEGTIDRVDARVESVGALLDGIVREEGTMGDATAPGGGDWPER